MIGQAVRNKYFPPEGRVASLAFIYSPEDIDRLRGRRLPQPALAMIAAKKRRLRQHDLKVMLFAFPPLLLLFGIIALSADIPSARKLAIFLIGVGACAVIAAMSQVSRWFTHSRHTHPSELRVLTARAMKQPDGRTIRFGQAADAPHWIFSSADAATIKGGAGYTVYCVHDVLIYLEETAQSDDSGS